MPCMLCRANQAHLGAGDAAWAVDSARGDFIPHEVLEVPERVDYLQWHDSLHAQPVLSGPNGAQHSQTGALNCYICIDALQVAALLKSGLLSCCSALDFFCQSCCSNRTLAPSAFYRSNHWTKSSVKNGEWLVKGSREACTWKSAGAQVLSDVDLDVLMQYARSNCMHALSCQRTGPLFEVSLSRVPIAYRPAACMHQQGNKQTLSMTLLVRRLVRCTSGSRASTC